MTHFPRHGHGTIVALARETAAMRADIGDSYQHDLTGSFTRPSVVFSRGDVGFFDVSKNSELAVRKEERTVLRPRFLPRF